MSNALICSIALILLIATQRLLNCIFTNRNVRKKIARVMAAMGPKVGISANSNPMKMIAPA